MPEKLQLVDADTLLSTPMEKALFIVDSLIPQGVSMLCGSGKIGKSWLMLWLGIRVAQGLPLWELPTHQSDVLYLCLEDTRVRIQNRLYQLTDEAPPGLRFATVCGKLGCGLEEQIIDALNDYPKTKLIIIDTLQKVRDSRSVAGKNGMYANDYDDISTVKQIADRFKIAIVLVHHLRKLKDSAELHREEIPQFLFRLVDFLKDKTEWSGTATELLSVMQETETSPNLVTKMLGRFASEVFAPAGIEYKTKRTGQSRLMRFRKCDSNDDDDGNFAI